MICTSYYLSFSIFAICVYVRPKDYLVTMHLTYSLHTNHYIKVAIFYKKQAEVCRYALAFK